MTRGSSRILKSAPGASFRSSSSSCCSAAPCTIVLNLSIPNSRSPTPIRRSRKSTGPRRVELDRRRDQQPQRQSDEDDDPADDEVERPLHDPVRAGEDRRAQLEERDALAGHVLAPLHEQLGRPRRQPHLDAGPMRDLDDLEHGLLVEVALVQDHLVRTVALDPAREQLAPAAARTCRRTRRRARPSPRPARACSPARL